MVKSESVRILVIEDEVKLATHLSRALEAEGHELGWCTMAKWR